MAYLSESILDDVKSREFSAASQIQQQQSSSFSKDIHPGEWQYCVCVEWEPWIEDVLLTYASAFNICLIESEDDLDKLHKHKIDFGKSDNPIYTLIGFSEYAVIEFDANDYDEPQNRVRMLMMMLLSAGQAACYIAKSPSRGENPVYI